MSEKEMYDRALNYATEKHKWQIRKGGEPYIVHPVAVSVDLKNKGFPIDYQITALFHDLLEDTDATAEEILALSDESVLNAVKLLTKKKGYVMKEYIDGIKSSDMALSVKIADRLDNLRNLYKADMAFVEKYVRETEDWFIDLSDEIKNELLNVKRKFNL